MSMLHDNKPTLHQVTDVLALMILESQCWVVNKAALSSNSKMASTSDSRASAEAGCEAPAPLVQRLGGLSRLCASLRRPCSAVGKSAACDRGKMNGTDRPAAALPFVTTRCGLHRPAMVLPATAVYG